MVFFGKKWLLSGNSGCIRTKVVLFWQKLMYSGKVVVFGKKWLYSGKVVVFVQSGCIRAKVVVIG